MNKTLRVVMNIHTTEFFEGDMAPEETIKEILSDVLYDLDEIIVGSIECAVIK